MAGIVKSQEKWPATASGKTGRKFLSFAPFSAKGGASRFAGRAGPERSEMAAAIAREDPRRDEVTAKTGQCRISSTFANDPAGKRRAETRRTGRQSRWPRPPLSLCEHSAAAANEHLRAEQKKPVNCEGNRPPARRSWRTASATATTEQNPGSERN